MSRPAETTGWIVLVYKIPSEPSKNRLQIWRKVRQIGAIYVQNGVCVLPAQPSTSRLFRALAQRIETFNGQAFLFETALAGEVDTRKLKDGFNEARNREYAEILEQCGDFLQEVEQETARGNFTVEEVEEIEEDLSKLKRWSMRIRSRDWFVASLGAKVAGKLNECEVALGQFITLAYESDRAASERAPHL